MLPTILPERVFDRLLHNQKAVLLSDTQYLLCEEFCYKNLTIGLFSIELIDLRAAKSYDLKEPHDFTPLIHNVARLGNLCGFLSCSNFAKWCKDHEHYKYAHTLYPITGSIKLPIWENYRNPYQ